MDGDYSTLLSNEQAGDEDENPFHPSGKLAFKDQTHSIDGIVSYQANSHHCDVDTRQPRIRTRRESFQQIRDSSLQHIKSFKGKLLLVIAGSAIIIVTAMVWRFYEHSEQVQVLDGAGVAIATFDKTNLHLRLAGAEGVAASLGAHLPYASELVAYAAKGLKWAHDGTSLSLTASVVTHSAESLRCVKVSWTAPSDAAAPSDCFDVTGDNVWYDSIEYQLFGDQCESGCVTYAPGGFHTSAPTGDILRNQGGAAIDPIWYSSQGVVIKASTHHSLQVCTTCKNETRRICLTAVPTHQPIRLDYAFCVGKFPSSVQVASAKFLRSHDTYDNVNDGASSDVIGETIVPSSSLVNNCSRLMARPLWSMVVAPNSTESAIVLDMAPIVRIGGTVHLADLTSVYTKLGDFSHSSLFTTMLTYLHKANFTAMVPVTPFVNYDAEGFAGAIANQYLLRVDNASSVPALTHIPTTAGHFYPGVVDVTDDSARGWFIANTRQMLNDVDYVHIYYGQAAWLPAGAVTAAPLNNPAHFSTLFAYAVAAVDQCAVSDAAYDSQHLDQFIKLTPGVDMASTLRLALASGLAGYPFFVASFPCSLQEAPNLMERGAMEEEMMRWVEMVAFFPVMPLPWDYSTLVQHGIDVTRFADVIARYVTLRNRADVARLLKAAVLSAEQNRTAPVVAPMWMAPGVGMTAEVLQMEDQFMVGEDMMVAPVLREGVVTRDVFVPPGKWKDIVTGFNFTVAAGGRWLRHYSVPVENIPVFVRI